jgi:hypothetical protein
MRRLHVSLLPVALCAAGALSGCTSESLRVAIEAQHRADEVQQTVFEHQHEGLCILLYRDLVGRLEAAGPPLSDDQKAALNSAWNERDLIEFWARQQERAAALRVAGVDALLYGNQSATDLAGKLLGARGAPPDVALAGAVAGQPADGSGEPAGAEPAR